MINNLSENALELEAMKKIKELFEYDAVDCMSETFGEGATLGRQSAEDVVLLDRLKENVIKINSHLPIDAIDDALNTLLEGRATLSLVDVNKHYYSLLKSGIEVIYKDSHGIEQSDRVQIIDWETPKNNNFLITRQFKISGEIYNCRADMVLFVNGLPLVFIELKSSHKHLENAYNDNIKHYLKEIPKAFYYNAFIIISNGSETKVGSLTSPLEHFAEWKKINDEGEQGVISLDTVIKAMLPKEKLIDIIENFILFQKTKRGTIKIIGKNHQFLGVNKGYHNIADKNVFDSKKLGVFWHTQGSGKSFSMVFMAQKVFRKLAGNWTFLIVTDREDLDDQIHSNFVNTGVITEKKIKATSRANLKKLLSEDHRYVFTTIQKFEDSSEISNRSDIIVFTDEAHRTQYGKFAMYMRKALPNASLMAFTGTPLMKDDEKTKEEFGDYVSIYNFEQSVLDKATVKLYYENRRPDLQIINPEMDAEIQKVIEEAELTTDQEEKFSKEYASMYQAITRDDRLEKIAEDIIDHFMSRGYMGKAMYVAIDKATAIKMYDKVKHHWGLYIQKLKQNLKNCDTERRSTIQQKIQYMQETDMAVVVSAAQNEIETCLKKGANIAPHRIRMNKEPLDDMFKDLDNPLRIVFVCSMWITGFDAKCVSTMYLDKILKDHTLMQTIARANRVAEDKNNGIIVDYIGIFGALQKALAIYGNVRVDDKISDETPAFNKKDLIEMLDKSSKKMKSYCNDKSIDVSAIINETDNFNKIALCDNAIEAILETDKTKEDFLNNAAELKRLLKAVLPDAAAEQYIEQVMITSILSAKINMKLNPKASKEDIEELADKVADILNRSIKVSDYKIEEKSSFDLTAINFDLLKEKYGKSKQKTLIEQLKAGIKAKILDLAKLNKHRLEYMEKLQEIVDKYNCVDANLDQFLHELVNITKELNEEEKRHIQENLSEEELVIYDILTRPEPKLSKEEIKQVKSASKALLETIKKERLNAGWRRMQSGRAKLKVTIDNICDSMLPSVYEENIFKEKCDMLYMHFYDNYPSATQSVYM